MTTSTPQSDASEQVDWFRLTNDFHARGTGEIRDRSDNVVWHHREHADRNSWVSRILNWILPSWATSFFRRPDFVVLNNAEEEVLRIIQVKRFPRRRFVMVASGSVLGEFEERGIISDSYAAHFADSTRWSISRPLFSSRVLVVSDKGTGIRYDWAGHNNWFIHRGDTRDNLQLIATIAFVQSEHCRW